MVCITTPFENHYSNFVLFVLDLTPFVLQYCSRSFSIGGNAAGVCEKRTASLAKSSIFFLFHRL